MCGICCLLYASSRCQTDNEKHASVPCKVIHADGKSRLSNRGPDKSCECHMQLNGKITASFSGHVLHLRGTEMSVQPAKDCYGNLLLWNGEIFNGIEVAEDASDTHVLLEKLGGCDSDESLLSTLSQIQGPWAFIYWQQSQETLWFGRDVFGRRSLLWHLPRDNSDVFALSSVQIKPWDFSEVPSVGIYKLTMVECEAEKPYELTLFPWQHAVWPGTLDPVKDSVVFAEKLIIGQDSRCHVITKLHATLDVPSQMPLLNKTLPPSSHSVQDLQPDQEHIQYLQDVLESDPYMKTLSHQLADVLLQAVKTRVLNQPKHKKINILENDEKDNNVRDKTNEDHSSSNFTSSGQHLHHLSQDHLGGASNIPECNSRSHDCHMTSSARVAILFSGGIDSTVIAALADRCVPKTEPIDLLNVAFEQRQKAPAQPKKKRPVPIDESERWNVPDRLTGYTALSELNPDRHWNFIEVNITAEELQEARQSHIQELVYPLQTVLDDSIGCAVWFAARGQGVLSNGPDKGALIHSDARVILCGMGADEQLVGYSRHRNRYKEGGWPGLMEEIELEVTRISARNLGRDDRIITDHGKESRFPFLDEQVVKFLSDLPIYHKANLDLPRGLGEKLLLRLSAVNLGLCKTATLPKRAIQFGSRIAKLENSKEKATDVCHRLTKLTT